MFRLQVTIIRQTFQYMDMTCSVLTVWEHVMGLNDNPTCRKCGTEEETSVHILCEGEALTPLRHTYLGSFFLKPEDIRVLGMGTIWNFVKGTGLL